MPVIVAAMLLAGGSAVPLRAEQLYYAVGQPVTVMVDVARGTPVELALIDADGELVGRPQPVGRGRVNLARLLPEIAGLDETAYVQCLIEGDPTGSPLVVQPLLSRRTPRTEIARRPDGTPYTRIVGWGPPPETPGRDDGSGEVVFSGLRVYPERDVVLKTGHGDIRLAMRPDAAPNTTWNFVQLVEGRFYDGLTFHRVVPLTRDGDPFVIQGGDPAGNGEGGPGYWLPMEPSDLAHDFGVVSMARADDPDSAGSQFFICLSRAGTARLDGQYCAFGEAVAGTDAIRAIAAVELADVAAGRPQQPPVIAEARFVAAPPRLPGHGRPDRPLSAGVNEPITPDGHRQPR